MKVWLFGILSFVLLAVSPNVYAQLYEDFSSGTFSGGAHWEGDTAKFRFIASSSVPAEMRPALQLYDTEAVADSAMEAELSAPMTFYAADTLTWSFWTRLSFTPNANNRFVFVLCASRVLNAASYVEVGGGDKTVGLYVQGVPVVVCDEGLLTHSVNQVRVKVCRYPNGMWHLWVDTVGGATTKYDFVGGATVADDVTAECDAIGFVCYYKKSNATKFYIDDIVMERGSTGRQEEDSVAEGKMDLCINEILFNPEPGGADYVELFNRGGDTVDLRRLLLAQCKGDSVTKYHAVASAYRLAPGDYVVLTTDASYVLGHYRVDYPQKIVELGTMPSYNDESGTVMIARADSTVIDRFDYTESMHSRLLHDVEGVALERRSANVATQEQGNWYSAASTAGYGTPTRRNSQSQEILFLEDDFRFSPEVFSPDGDGYNDLCDITYSLSDGDLNANVSVFDERGRLVRHLLRGGVLGSEGHIVWDGLDDAGAMCRQGNYIVFVEAFDLQGHKQLKKKVVVLMIL